MIFGIKGFSVYQEDLTCSWDWEDDIEFRTFLFLEGITRPLLHLPVDPGRKKLDTQTDPLIDWSWYQNKEVSIF